MVKIEKSTGDVYADLGMADADEMIVKAQLATKIGEIIKGRKWSQQQAAKVLRMTQPKLSNMLRGQFRGISEAKMLDGRHRPGVSLSSSQLEQERGAANEKTTGDFPETWRGRRRLST